MARHGGDEDFRMRQLGARLVARGRVQIEREGGAVLQSHRAGLEFSDPKLGTLQIDQDADRPSVFGLDRADRRHQLAHAVMRGVAHIDAEHVGPGAEQARDDAALG